MLHNEAAWRRKSGSQRQSASISGKVSFFDQKSKGGLRPPLSFLNFENA
jgi:hypothetical protein